MQSVDKNLKIQKFNLMSTLETRQQVYLTTTI